MNKEKIDSSIELMDDILDNLDKEPELSKEDYKSLENKYNDEVSKYQKLEEDYQNLFQKYKERFTETIGNSTKNYSEEKKEEPEEAEIIDIRSIF